jgi:hypothetical protein
MIRAATLLSFLLPAAAAAQQSFATNPDFRTGDEGRVVIFHIGPYTIPAGRDVSGKRLPGEYEFVVPAPNPGDVFLTNFDSRIVDLNRVPQDPAQLYLHHAVLVNRAATDLTCPLMPGERFAAAGAERVPFAIPRGHGYRIRATDPIVCILHMQNFTLQPQTVYYQYSMTVAPGSAPLQAVRPWWLDVVYCTSSYVVPIGTGIHTRSRDYVTPAKLTILTMGPHLHCGGIKLELIDTVQQKVLHEFKNKSLCPVQLDSVLPNPPLVLPANMTVTLRASYQQDPLQPLDAMGIMLGYVLLN